jgi:tRNA1Val (adenine37-N6)-methyltransferase
VTNGRTSENFTRDTIYRGRLTVVQPLSGYRFALDALLLADFARVRPGQRIVDLGAGVGVVALALALRIEHGRIMAVEIQPRLAACARENVKVNRLETVVEVLEMDWNDLEPARIGGPVQHAVANPPYRRVGTGRVSPDPEEAVARHELKGSLVSAAETAAGLLETSGLFSVIFPATRLVSLLAVLESRGLAPKRLRLVHSRPKEKAGLALVEARLGGGEELEILPPLWVYQEGNRYSEEVETLLEGPAQPSPAP